MESRTWQITRSGGAPPDKDVVVQRSRPFGAAVAQAGWSTLLLIRGEKSLSTYLVCPTGVGGNQVASSLTSAVSAKMDELDKPPDIPSSEVVGWVVAEPRDEASRGSQWGQDPTEVAQLIRRVMEPGQWAAVSIRAPSKGEIKATRRWYTQRLSGTVTHYSNEASSLIISIFAGGSSKDAVRGLLTQLTASLPGFDIEVGVKFGASSIGTATVLAGLSAASLSAGIYIHQIILGGLLFPAFLVLSVLSLLGRLPSRDRKTVDNITNGVIPIPPKRIAPPSPPRGESRRQDGVIIPARPGSWPLANQSFLVSPGMVVGIASPHAGAASDVSTTTMRSAPVALLEDIGPVVGKDGNEENVHISVSDLWAGVAVIGIPGTGKTNLVHNLWAWNVLERVDPSRKAGYPGADNTIIAFETKGDDVKGWQAWVQSLGDASVLSDLGRSSTPAIDIVPSEGTYGDKASFFANAMVYAFGDGEIQSRSYEAIVSVATAVFAANLPQAWSDNALPGNPHFINAMYVLLGGYGDEAAVSLAAAITDQSRNNADPQLQEAISALLPYFGKGSTVSNRRTLTESSRNKVKLLLEAGSWWSKDRPHFSWKQALDQHWAVVVNTGPSAGGNSVNERLTDVMSAMLLYSLRDSISKYCGGWQRENKSVSIFADELAILARNSPEVISWIRDQGRAYGVRPVFAAQYPEKLRPDVRTALMGFSTVFWFRQNVPSIASEAADHLSMGGVEWKTSDIVNLERYAAILLATVDGQAQPPVPIHTAYWEDPKLFRADQLETRSA